MHRPDPSGIRPKGPDTWYEDSYFNFDAITQGSSPELTTGIDQILQAGQQQLPLVAAWLTAELQRGTDFTFPGPKGKTKEADEAQIAEAIQDPRNIHIDSQGRISVVVVHSDPDYTAENDPHVLVDEKWIPANIAITRKSVLQRRDPRTGEIEFSKKGEPLKSRNFHEPFHAPCSLYFNKKELTLNDIQTLSPENRTTLARYGKALSEAKLFNGLPANIDHHLPEFKKRFREAIQKLIGEL